MSHRGNQREFRKYFDTSGKTIYQELRDASKVVLRNISVNDYIKKGERSQISNLIFHLENTENRRKLNLKKTEGQMNRIKRLDIREKSNETKSWLLRKINKIKPLDRRREYIRIENTLELEGKEVHCYWPHIKRIRCKLLELTQEEIDNLNNKPITSEEIESVIKKKNYPEQSPDPEGFTSEFPQTLRVNTNSSQTFPKNWNTSLITKTKDIIIKLQTSISYEHVCKNPQNTSKINPATYKENYIPWPSRIFPTNARLTSFQVNIWKVIDDYSMSI